MAEKFTVYHFQLRPDDFTRFIGAGEDDTYSEEEYSQMKEEEENIFNVPEDESIPLDVFGSAEDKPDFTKDVDYSEEVFDTQPEEEGEIFNIEEEI